jgi:hypothetical protein
MIFMKEKQGTILIAIPKPEEILSVWIDWKEVGRVLWMCVLFVDRPPHLGQPKNQQ